jgi:hypothetical protein
MTTKDTDVWIYEMIIGLIWERKSRQMRSGLFVETLPPISTDEGKKKWEIFVQNINLFAPFKFTLKGIESFIKDNEYFEEISYPTSDHPNPEEGGLKKEEESQKVLIIKSGFISEWHKEFDVRILDKQKKHLLKFAEILEEKGFFSDCIRICQSDQQIEYRETGLMALGK